MHLQPVLHSIASLRDLPQLVAALGHQPIWEAVPAEAWSKPALRSFSITAIGQSGKLPWLAVESCAPRRDAVLLARRISRRGRVALVVALDCRTRRLGMAVAFGRTPGIELDLANPDPELLTCITRLAGTSAGSPYASAAQAADALSSEPVGRRFFREFKTTLERMAAALPGPMQPADRQGLVLLQLTRVLFLYFIQTKGWLAGRDQFLAQEIDLCLSRRRRIHRDFLRPLFFGTLNQPEAARSRTARQFGPIPFLNGGLFEPHPLERRHRSDIPNPLWRDAFDGLFQRFHFTTVEGGTGGSVAPDMLGRVFEGVMAPEARRASGTFYTPAKLVEQMLDAALIVVLATRLRCPEAEAGRRLHEQDPKAAKALESITVLDPAVGSGAFLLGALNRLSTLGTPGVSAAQKRRVLKRSLFGVDQNVAAVRLTELRLWLSVIADDPADRAESVHPLPNLDCLIRQGDSLFDPEGLDLGIGPTAGDEDLADELSNLRAEVISAAGSNKSALVRRLRALEARALDQSFQAAEGRHRAAIADCLELGRAPDLFGQQRGLDPQLRVCLTDLRFRLRALRQARRRLSVEGEIPWFHYQSAFADVFARGGFDLVIGNPPWLRSEAIPPQIRKRLSDRYRWFRPGGRRFGSSADLAVAFLQRSFELAAPHGAVALLVPAKIARAGYGAAARHALAASTTLHALADLSGTTEAAFDATVYPLALVARRSMPRPTHWVRTGLSLTKCSRVRQSALRGGGPWILNHHRVHAVLAGLQRDHPVLSHGITCHLGVKTGLNQLFLSPPADVEPEVLRWAVRGRDVKPFRCCPRLRLLWTHDVRGEPSARLPPRAQAYLDRHEAALRARHDYQTGPAWTVFRTRPAAARYRVVWSDLARRLTAAALTTRHDLTRIPLNTCYVAAVHSAGTAHALAGWLNSTWIQSIAALLAVPASGGYSRFNARVVGQLPLPSSAMVDVALVRLARAGRAGEPVQAELDGVVAQHLGLSGRAQEALRAAVDRGPFHRR